MRQLIAALIAATSLTACGSGSSDLVSADQSDLRSCSGLKSAHCFCQVMGGPSNGPAGHIIPANDEGETLFTYTIPDKCYNQQLDILTSHEGGGCWLDCRNAFGVDGATIDPAVVALKVKAAAELRAQGACGGWINAPLNFAAGTNKFRAATAVGIGIGIGGTVVEVNGQQVCR